MQDFTYKSFATGEEEGATHHHGAERSKLRDPSTSDFQDGPLPKFLFGNPCQAILGGRLEENGEIGNVNRLKLIHFRYDSILRSNLVSKF